MSENPSIGKPISRIEGYQKVTGAAKYAGEYNVPDLLYGYVVNSSITKGKIKKIHTKEVKNLPGVIEVFTHSNRPSLPWLDLKYADMDAPPGSVFRFLYDNEIKYNGQPVALIVAESFEMARYAAAFLRIDYIEDKNFNTDIKAEEHKAHSPQPGLAMALKPPPPSPKGDINKAFKTSYAQAAGEFTHGTEHHNPMELFATTTVYEGDGKLTIYDKTQGTINCQMYVANVFGLKMKNVRVVTPYMGGGFGSGLRPQYQLFMAVMASLSLKRNVRVTLSREQMYTFGHRPPTIQRTLFSAEADGRLNGLYHSAIGETSQFEDYTEMVVNWSGMLYPAQNSFFEHKLVSVDVYSPLDMRAPGGSTGMHAVEITMDMLAYELGMDPLDLRIKNYTEIDGTADRPFSSKELMQCYLQGAEKFGWYNRNPQPGSMKRNGKRVGYGMATGMWDANRIYARAEAILTPEGKLRVNNAVTDIGTGTLTVMTQIAADTMGMPIDDVTFNYGDSKMPFAPIQGGSFTVATVGSAVVNACHALIKKLLKKAKNMEGSPLKNAKPDDIEVKNGYLILKKDQNIKVSFKDIIAANGGKSVKTTNSAMPNPLKAGKYSHGAHSAVFAEVEIDDELGTIDVTRALTVVAAGNIINPKTAKSQILGGMIWGISKALHEETITDHRFGKYMNQNLAEYHIPVHADIFDLDAFFVDEKDTIVNELGVKGVGEIGIVGMAPAIANAIYHATGKRINNLPIHFDALM